MTTWFNEPSENFPFAKIGALIDTPTANSIVSFSEGIFRKAGESAIDCFLFAESVTDCKKAGESNWQFKPCPIYFQIHSESYEKFSKDKSKSSVEPSAFSKFLFGKISTFFNEEKIAFLKGKITFSEPMASTTASVLITGESNGKDLSEDTRKFLESQLIELEKIESLERLKIEDLPSTSEKKFWLGSSSKNQPEIDRLNDRTAWISQSFKSLFESSPSDLGEIAAWLANLQESDKKLYLEIKDLLSLLLSGK